jgi:hypothetical protein
MHKYVLLVTGPHPYLQGGPKIEEFEITQAEIEENREGSESDEEVISYLLDEACAEWEQRWCRAQAFTLGQYKIICPDFKSSI